MVKIWTEENDDSDFDDVVDDDDDDDDGQDNDILLPGKSGEGDMDGGGRGRESSVCHCPGILAYMVSLDYMVCMVCMVYMAAMMMFNKDVTGCI